MIRRRVLAAALLILALAGGSGCSRRASQGDIKAWTAEIAALQAEQDSLRSRADAIVAADPRIQNLPKGDVVFSLPTAFVRNVIERVFEDVAKHTTLRLTGIKTHVEKSIKKIITIGSFVVDVDIKEVVGKLQTGRPDMIFGNDAIAMSLPVEVNEGRGDATIRFQWDGKNIADLTCGDMDITQKVTGNVIPSKYVINGRLKLAIAGGKVVCTPVFPETKLNIRIRPSKETWAAINAILAEKHGACGFVLDKVDVPNLLRGVVEEKGFNVGLPLAKLKTFTIPGGVSDTVMVAGRPLAIASTVNSIRVDPDAIWYAATVSLSGQPDSVVSPSAPGPPPAPR